jgi:hypothetical protein
MQEYIQKHLGKQSILIVIFIVVCFGVYLYSDKYMVRDRMSSLGYSDISPSPTTEPIPTPLTSSTSSNPSPVDAPNPSGYGSSTTADPSDLLPKDVNREWAQLNPVGSSNIVGSDLLDSKAFIGQVSQVKGIMNLDIRAAPPVEMISGITPWNMSSYEPDINRTGIQCTN